MRRSAHDRDFVLAMEVGGRLLVEVEDDLVAAAHDEERRCSHRRQGRPGQIWPSAPAHDSFDLRRPLSSRNQGGRCARRRSEQANRQR